ncbi:MAG TPA: hypothetical protein VMU24_00020 [Candidatus Acidoferrales bacterium]|nr:hypothetical protein [Candidatus Acidoferrales bacterium]
MSEPVRVPEIVEPDAQASRASTEITLVPFTEIPPMAAARWWRIADFGVLGAWIAVVAFTLRYHEKWADEAQAWLIARDLDLKTIWLHELRYEGSPGLWHTILWVAQHVFHARYDALGYVGMAGATAGVALLIFKAPFPRYIRWPLAFTYFMVYQYAVIARPYTMLPLLAFAAAILFKDLEHPERMTVVLVLLANLSLHGTILAGCLGLIYVLDAYRARERLDARVRRKYWICIGVMAAVFVFIVLILKPTPDIEEFVLRRQFAQLPADARAQMHIPTLIGKLSTVISGAFLDWWMPSLAFVLLAAAWCFSRRRLLLFLLTVGSLIVFYAAVHGAAHHHGSVFVAAICAVWIAWPSSAELRSATARQRLGLQGITASLLCLCALNVWDAGVVIEREYLYPYSGAQDAATYLKSVNATEHPMFGFLFGVTAVDAYFDQNIFANMPTSFFHHGLPLFGTNLNIDDLHRINPEYVVAYSIEPDLMLREGIPQLTAEGYQMVHFSDGYYLYKRAVFERETYFILRRMRP